MTKIQSPELGKDSGVYEARKRQSLRARYFYGLIFFATNLLAWFIRDYGAKVFHGLHRRFLALSSICRFLHLKFCGIAMNFRCRILKCAVLIFFR
jgi:hypothetical protein